MDLSSALPQQIAKALAHGSTVLTANQRAARTLHHAFDLHQRTLGHVYWQPPAILSWDAWLVSLWHQLLLQGHASDLLLNSTQEQTIWRAIIAADSANAGLHPIDALAQTAADAWLRLHQYRARKLLLTYPGNADTRTFTNWAAEFDRRCARSRFTDQAQLPETLCAAIAKGHLTLPSGLLLIGFDSKTPAQIALLEAIGYRGPAIAELDLSSPAPSLTLAAALDEHSDITACANWLRDRLTQQPASRIAVIVPALETSRAQIDRLFRPILAPELDNIASPTATGPYEFSLGVPLAHTPLAATALDILRWIIHPLPLDRISALLLSPYFATPADSERLARAEFDAFALRRQHLLQPQLSLAHLQRLASHTNFAAGLPTLLKHLRILDPLVHKRDLTKAFRSCADWAATFHELLDAAGWAVPGHLDSIEFQTRRKWESALDELTTLDFDSEAPRIVFADALAALQRIADDTLFAPESRHAPIQIMGPLESAGSNFDAIWFLRANDLAWPSTPAPNPLLPWHLQRELRMPGADPAHDAVHARRITERIAASAPAVVFSYAQYSSDSPQRPSPALAALALDHHSATQIAPPQPARSPIELESSHDDSPIPPPPDRGLQGGATILQAQAACGFRAFAEKRLFASTVDPSSLGLDSAERGSLIHAVLEHFWAEVKTQAALKRMSDGERTTQLSRSIDIAFARHHARPEPGWPRAYLDAEHQRLLNLLSRWLEYEATQRPPFTVKAREEELSDVPIGPLHLNIRVDRVDVVHTSADSAEPTGEIILDYKTGKTSPSDWLGERPNEPQLPLYAVVSNTPNLAAIAFATLRPGTEMLLRGYQAEDDILPKSAKLKTETLKAQVNEWKAVLTALAVDFHSGRAQVSPKSYPQTCKYCAQRLLCRLDPSTLEADTLDDADTESDSPAEADRG